MYDALNPLKLVVSLVLVILFLVGIINVFGYILKPSLAESEAVSKAYAGEIVDKKIINARSGLFASSDIDYRLVIKVEYEVDGKLEEARKSISVDKDLYLQANIGDWFDSHTLEVIKK